MLEIPLRLTQTCSTEPRGPEETSSGLLSLLSADAARRSRGRGIDRSAMSDPVYKSAVFSIRKVGLVFFLSFQVHKKRELP